MTICNIYEFNKSFYCHSLYNIREVDLFSVLFRDTPLAHICCTWSDGRMVINGQICLPDFIANNQFLIIFPLKFPLKSKIFTDSGRNGRRTKTKTVLKSGNKMEHFETM